MAVIRVSPENKKRIATFGDASQSMNDCIETILLIAENHRDEVCK